MTIKTDRYQYGMAMTEDLKCSACGSKEFVSDLDSYSVYQAEGGKLHFVSAELINDDTKIHCRDCSAELDTEGVKFAP